MKALTLTQPWASLIAIGAKLVETRAWSTQYRGPIAIHAAKFWQVVDRETCWDPLFRAALEPTGLVDYAPYTDLDDGDIERFALPLGGIVATAELLNVCRTEHIADQLTERERAFGDYYPGRFAWSLAVIRKLPEPIPCRGSLGLWDVPDDVATALRDAEREG